MSEQHYYYSTGKRKNAIAKVRLYPGTGGIVVNGKPLEEVFPWRSWQTLIEEPLKITNTLKSFNIVVGVKGSGVVSQAGAIRHGISRALTVADGNLRQPLKRNGLLTRDAREKESKKYGLKRARKAKQYTKR